MAKVYTASKTIEHTGALPITINANGLALADYRVYGAAGGVGDYVAPEYKQVHTDTVTIDGIVWDILGYDHDTVYKSDNTIAQHSVTIQAHDVLSDMQFDAKEALFAFENGLAAGTYHFTVGAQPWYASDIGKTIQFTLTQAIPAGGQLVINNAYNATMVGATISAFASGTATTATETVTMSEGNDGTDLGTVSNGLSQDGITNSIQRAFLGSNKWSESAIRQYLNSSASVGSVWEPKHKWDRPPFWEANTAGFLNGLSADFIANLGTASKTTALNTVTDGGDTGTTLDKVFLLSRSEVYTGNEVAGGEGAAYPYYSDFSDLSAPGTGEDTNRIKKLNGTAKYWWLRSPNASSTYLVRTLSPSGALNYSAATNTIAVSAACCIPLDDIDTNDWLREKFLKNPSTAFSYEVDMSVSDGTTSTITTIYIGSDPLNAYEYIDYASGKIYRWSSNQLFVPEVREKVNEEVTCTVSNDGVYTLTVSDTVQSDRILSFSYNPVETPDGKTWVVAAFAENILDDNGMITLGDAIHPVASAYIRNNGYNVNRASSPSATTYILDRMAITVRAGTPAGTFTLRPMLMYIEPTNPPIPLPALPTVKGTTIVDYDGVAKPSEMYIKYNSWSGWEDCTPKIWKNSANYFDAEFEQGSFDESRGELRTYEQLKMAASNRIRTKDLVLIDGQSVLSINAGYRLFICYFDSIGRYYKSGDYYPGYTNWTTNPIYFPIGGHTGVPAAVALGVSRTDNGAISPSDLPNIEIMLNHGSSPLPYEPPGTGWTAAPTYTYTNGAWVPDT